MVVVSMMESPNLRYLSWVWLHVTLESLTIFLLHCRLLKQLVYFIVRVTLSPVHHSHHFIVRASGVVLTHELGFDIMTFQYLFLTICECWIHFYHLILLLLPHSFTAPFHDPDRNGRIKPMNIWINEYINDWLSIMSLAPAQLQIVYRAH